MDSRAGGHLAHTPALPPYQTATRRNHVFLTKEFKDVRVVIPQAPTRKVTLTEKEAPSWFDIKFRNEKSFLMDFDEVFSTKEVDDSYQKYLYKGNSATSFL